MQRFEEPPDNFDSPEWKRYNDLCEESERNGLGFTEEMRWAYADYYEARKRGLK